MRPWSLWVIYVKPSAMASAESCRASGVGADALAAVPSAIAAAITMAFMRTLASLFFCTSLTPLRFDGYQHAVRRTAPAAQTKLLVSSWEARAHDSASSLGEEAHDR